jgi:hypothetical protein
MDVQKMQKELEHLLAETQYHHQAKEKPNADKDGHIMMTSKFRI